MEKEISENKIRGVVEYEMDQNIMNGSAYPAPRVAN
jgi:hypothetical protein